MATKKTLRIEQKDGRTINSITSEEVNLDSIAKEMETLIHAKQLSPMPHEDIVQFAQKIVENHNKMTADIVMFWCPELQSQV